MDFLLGSTLHGPPREICRWGPFLVGRAVLKARKTRRLQRTSRDQNCRIASRGAGESLSRSRSGQAIRSLRAGTAGQRDGESA